MIDLNFNKNTKSSFVGISMSNSANYDTGIAILNENLDIIRIDKAYSVDDITQYLDELTGKEDSIICVDLPRNNQMLQGKWRMESKFNKALFLDGSYKSEQKWAERISDRGSDLCSRLKASGFDVFRYNCFFAKNALNLISPYKLRSPAACKSLQMAFKDQLLLNNIPSNMIPLSGLDAIVGAYISRQMYVGKYEKDFKFIGEYKSMPIVSALKSLSY